MSRIGFEKVSNKIPKRLAKDNLLEMKGMFKSRHQGGATFELSVPAVSLHAGEFIAVVGESGCGKSTLLDILALVLRPPQCERFCLQQPESTEPSNRLDISALWDTLDEKSLANIRRNHLGYVLQTGGLLAFLTVWQNLQLPMRVKGVFQDRIKIDDLVRRMGVEGLLGIKPQFLSGGQRHRVAILRALVHKPAIVLADEPTAAVDKSRARKIVQDFQSLAKDEGTAIVMVTHDQGLVADVADRVFGFEVSQESESMTRSVCTESEAL